jgi:hypothetical protein
MFILKTISTKTVKCEFHKSNIFADDGVTTIKSGHQTTRNMCMVWSDGLSFMLFPTSGRVYILRTPKEAYNPECLVPTVKHRGGSVMA